MFQHVPRVARECEELARELGLRCPVLSMLENVSHGPPEVRRAIDAAMCGPPVTIHACSFGWVRRTRCSWGSLGHHAMSEFPLKPPNAALLEQDARGNWHGLWSGKKPLPETVNFHDHFKPAFDPRDNIGRIRDAECLATFTQAFDHPVVPDVQASPEAIQRCTQDGRTFPAFASRMRPSLSCGNDWRQVCSSERAEVICPSCPYQARC